MSSKTLSGKPGAVQWTMCLTGEANQTAGRRGSGGTSRMRSDAVGRDGESGRGAA